MAKETAVDEQLTEDMNESELAEGLEDAFDAEAERTDRRLDREGAEPGEDQGGAGDGDGEGEDPDDDEDLDELDDDEDDDLDEDDETDLAGASGTKALADGYTEDAKGQVHRADGTMATKEEAEKVRAKVAAAAGSASAPGATAQQGAPAGTQQQGSGAQEQARWEPFKINADRKEHVIEEAVGIQRRNGHVFIAIPDGEKFNQFSRRLGIGIVAQRMSRDLDARIRDFEAMELERKENPEPSATEVQADVFLKALRGEAPYNDARWLTQDEDGQMQPRIKALFEPWQQDILERDAKLALHEAKTAHTTKAEERRTAQTQAAADEQRWNVGLGEAIDLVLAEKPEWVNITDAQLRDLIAELRPLTKSLLGKEEDGTMFLTQSGAAVIRRVLSGTAGAQAPAATGTDPKTGQPGSATAGDKHDRFNEGVNSGKQPPSTSVKDRRDVRNRSRRGNREERRNSRSGRRDNRTSAQRAEDAVRKAERSWMNSNTLDLPDGFDE